MAYNRKITILLWTSVLIVVIFVSSVAFTNFGTFLSHVLLSHRVGLVYHVILRNAQSHPSMEDFSNNHDNSASNDFGKIAHYLSGNVHMYSRADDTNPGILLLVGDAACDSTANIYIRTLELLDMKSFLVGLVMSSDGLSHHTVTYIAPRSAMHSKENLKSEASVVDAQNGLVIKNSTGQLVSAQDICLKGGNLGYYGRLWKDMARDSFCNQEIILVESRPLYKKDLITRIFHKFVSKYVPSSFILNYLNFAVLINNSFSVSGRHFLYGRIDQLMGNLEEAMDHYNFVIQNYPRTRAKHVAHYWLVQTKQQMKGKSQRWFEVQGSFSPQFSKDELATNL